MQLFNQIEGKNEDIKITCAEIAKYTEKKLQSTTILQRGKHASV